MSATFTSGPWWLDPETLEIYDSPDRGELIASVGNEGEDDPEDVRPNARLVVTAPELYAALEAIVGTGRACARMHEVPVSTCELCAGRAVLAKARVSP